MSRTNAQSARMFSRGVSHKECGLQMEQKSLGTHRLCSWQKRHACGARVTHRKHRAFHAGAVLSVVNALRFASTRPVPGPAGIDDASARHLFATTRRWATCRSLKEG